ncbi:MAG: hypothetical protein ACTIBG_16000 [Brevibacterium aurantiacum]|uniref:hypothetical protein n=1 Tax=Brevibacterium aurantiacum TaxID=273384 RepID=UPI001867EEC8|nr:hypothetical protein [Brevibacterium aurantiacum]
MRVDRLTDLRRRLLLDRIFTDLPASLSQIHESLKSPQVHAIEIYDRGTSGLEGPFRAFEEAPRGKPNNFNSFVFDIGSTSDSQVSGGTYGFGKTATFQVSKSHCVVYWSRCLNQSGEPEHRLIASALHDPYAEQGVRFTGAHWWGTIVGGDVEPLRGDEAEAIGRAIFQSDFGVDETGTSILILDPEISLEQQRGSGLEERVPVRTVAHAEELVRQIADAMAFSAWPKTTSTDGVSTPMNIELHHGTKTHEVATAIRSGYSRWASALARVRAAQGQQSSESIESTPPGVIREKIETIRLRPNASLRGSGDPIFGGRTDNVVGHLYLVASVRSAETSVFEVPRNRLCLMRSLAELVVRYDEVGSFDDDAVQWHAVFKPTPECDRHFSASEPSTHDSWTPRAAEEEVSTYVVSRALHQVRSKTRAFLTEGKTVGRSGERSVRKVAMALRSFVPTVLAISDDQASSQPGSRSSVRRRGRHTAVTDLEVISSQRLPDGQGQELVVRPVGIQGESRIMGQISLFARSQDGRMELNNSEAGVIWKQNGVIEGHGRECLLDVETDVHIEIRTHVATAVEVVLRGEAV